MSSINNQENERDLFFRTLDSMRVTSPDKATNIGYIYDMLELYGFSKKEIENRDISSHWSGWIERYKNSHLNVYCDERMKSFLQFHNIKSDINNHVKLYIPIDNEGIKESVNIIMDYLDAKNIGHNSKVCHNNRTDAIIVRLENSKDAIDVVNYINSQPYLIQHAKKTNPFLQRNGIVGLAYDGYLSYNNIVSTMIAQYNYECIVNRKPITYEGFQQFFRNYYFSVFHGNRKQEFMQTELYKSYIYRAEGEPVDLFMNFKNVFKLIGINMFVGNDLNKFIECFEETRTNNTFYNIKQEENKEEYNKGIIDAKSDLLKAYIICMQKKGTSLNSIITTLNEYFNTENPLLITTDYNFREQFKTHLKMHDLVQITNGRIFEYVSSIYNENAVSRDNVVKNENRLNEEKYEQFLSACKQTYLKYSNMGYEDQLEQAINAGLAGNYHGFTNDGGGGRNFLKTHVSPDEFKRFVQVLTSEETIRSYTSPGKLATMAIKKMITEKIPTMISR